MDHAAIMRKDWGSTEKILSGEKTIESRWYVNRSRPWEKIRAGETVYFKNSGEFVDAKAEVARVLQFENLSPEAVKEILQKYGKRIGIEKRGMRKFYAKFKNKRYCILIFLKNPKQVRPFDINKTGFGSMSAWMSMPRIQKTKTPSSTARR